MTDNDKLAIFAGAHIANNALHQPLYVFPDGHVAIPAYKFDPVHDWNHLKLVLEALVKKQGGWANLFCDITCKYYDAINENNDFDFPQAIIDAALVVINSK